MPAKVYGTPGVAIKDFQMPYGLKRFRIRFIFLFENPLEQHVRYKRVVYCCVGGCVCESVCVCVRERGRDRERQKKSKNKESVQERKCV